MMNYLNSVRYIPDWLPGAGFKRLPPGTREALVEMRYAPYKFVLDNVVRRTLEPSDLRYSSRIQASGAKPECYVTSMLEMTQHEDEQAVIDTAATLYASESLELCCI